MTQDDVSLGVSRIGTSKGSAVALLRPRQGDNSFPAEMSPVGLHIHEGITFDQWAGIGTVLQSYHAALPWMMADFLNWGETRWGEAHAQAIGDHYSPETLRTYRYVGERIAIDRRRPALSFGHHHAVARFEPAEQDELLDLAENEKWSRSALREEVKVRIERAAKSMAVATVTAAPQMPLEDAAPQTLDEECEPAHNNAPLDASPDAVVPGCRGEPGGGTSAVVEPPSADDTVTLLLSLVDTFPETLADAILTLTEDRTKLLRVLRAAEEAVIEFELPALRAAVEEYRGG